MSDDIDIKVTGDPDQHKLNVSMRLSPAQMGRLYAGRTAQELADMGFKVPTDIPGGCVLQADGSFEYFEASFTLTPEGAE